MSVLIKDEKMPKSCGNCFYDTRCDKWRLRNWGAPPPYDCPLVEIPPHGDLIDQHRLIDIGNHLKRTVKDRSDLDAAAGVAALLYYVIDAPTIIQAEETDA